MSVVEDLDYFRRDRAQMLRDMSMCMDQVHAKMIFRHEINSRPFTDFLPVDATPHFVDMETSSLEDLVVFRPLPSHELIVAPDTVPGLMDKILALQDPKMKELISEQRKQGDRMPQINNHCQIISIAS